MAAAFAVPCAAQAQPESTGSYAPLVKNVAPAVVNIYTKRVVKVRQVSPLMNDPVFRQFFGDTPAFAGGPVRERVERSLGSGVIIQADGLVVTSHHVIKDAQEITIVLSDRREFEATVVKRDPQTDLAFLKIKAKDPLPFLVLRDSDTLEVGDLAFAVGNPFGIGQTVTHGIVSGLARAAGGDARDYQFFIQTDAAINPGNSGGALVDAEGKLIGINTAIYSTSGGSNGIGFAIPSNMVKAVMGSEVKGGRVVRPWLGMSVQPVTGEIAESLALGAPRGVLVKKLTEKGPAEKAGIRSGDVITAVGGYEIDDARGLQYRIGTQPIGSTVTMAGIRQGKKQEFSVTLLSPPQEQSETQLLKGKHPLNGLEVATLTADLAEEYGLTVSEDSEGGVLVVAIGEGANGLFQRGDIILKVNNQRISKAAQLEAALKAAKNGWDVVIWRAGAVLTVSVHL